MRSQFKAGMGNWWPAARIHLIQPARRNEARIFIWPNFLVGFA